MTEMPGDPCEVSVVYAGFLKLSYAFKYTGMATGSRDGNAPKAAAASGRRPPRPVQGSGACNPAAGAPHCVRTPHNPGEGGQGVPRGSARPQPGLIRGPTCPAWPWGAPAPIAAPDRAPLQPPAPQGRPPGPRSPARRPARRFKSPRPPAAAMQTSTATFRAGTAPRAAQRSARAPRAVVCAASFKEAAKGAAAAAAGMALVLVRAWRRGRRQWTCCRGGAAVAANAGGTAARPASMLPGCWPASIKLAADGLVCSRRLRGAGGRTERAPPFDRRRRRGR